MRSRPRSTRWPTSSSVLRSGPVFRRSARQRKRGAGALAHFPFDAHGAALPQHHALRNGESDAESLELAFVMDALEQREQLAGVFHVESGPVTTHEKLRTVVVHVASELDAGGLRVPGELEGVIDQDAPDLPD